MTSTNNMVLPKIEAETTSRNYGKFIIGPLESGYGVTLGNALRRVLLASLTGAAASSIKVEGVHHEFTPIPHAKEDLTGLILNVKRGKGYSPAEERGKLPIDEIPIDAVYSPVKKANFRVEPARVGQMTNFDNLILEIWTDGSITPREALTEAAK